MYVPCRDWNQDLAPTFLLVKPHRGASNPWGDHILLALTRHAEPPGSKLISFCAGILDPSTLLHDITLPKSSYKMSFWCGYCPHLVGHFDWPTTSVGFFCL